MGRAIIRASQEVARYGVYSTIAGNFTYVNGTRKQTLEYLLDDYRPGSDRYEAEKRDAEQRLDSADRLGSDSFIGRGAWDDEAITIMNNHPSRDGKLPRENLAKFYRRVEHNKPTDDLIRPFEDEEDRD